jgi:hypothetical protein
MTDIDDLESQALRASAWRCDACEERRRAKELPIGWYQILVQTNLEHEGMRVHKALACCRACYDKIKTRNVETM